MVAREERVVFLQQEPRPRPRCEAGWPGEVDKEKEGEVVDRNKERKNKDKEEKRVERRVARMGGRGRSPHCSRFWCRPPEEILFSTRL